MAKAQKCRLIMHGSITAHDLGLFPSKAAAKRYVNACSIKVYSIVKI